MPIYIGADKIKLKVNNIACKVVVGKAMTNVATAKLGTAKLGMMILGNGGK